MLSACLLPHCCVYLTLLCLTGDLHRDSRHAALWCVLHGLSLHNGEQQQQRYCLNRFSSWSVFANLATSSPFFFFPSPLLTVFSALPGSFFLSILFSLSSHFFPPYSLFSVKQAPRRCGERACLVWVTATWSLTLPVLTLTLNLPGGQLSQVFSLCWHIFEFLSPHCLSKHCFPSFSLPVSSWESE